MSLSGLQKHPRYPLFVTVDVVTASAEVLQLTSANLSLGGIFLQTTAPAPLGSEVRMRLHSALGPIGLFGHVAHLIDEAAGARRSHPPGMGVQFAALPAATEELLQRIVDQLAVEAEQRKLRQAAAVFVDGAVTVRATRAVLQQLWAESLKHGGLFIDGSALPLLGASVKVLIGPLTFDAEVVHHDPGRGAGLQLKDLSGPKREALTRFVDGVDDVLIYQEVKNVGAPLQKLLADVRRLFVGIEINDGCAGLGLPPLSPEAAVQAALQVLGRALAVPPTDATPPQLARLQQAAAALGKFGPVALQQASSPPAPVVVRGPHKPGIRDSVSELLAQAADLERRGDRLGARKALANAIELAPDHPEVRKRLFAHDAAAELARAVDLLKNAEVFVQGVGMKPQAIAKVKEALALSTARELRLRAVRVLAKAGADVDAISVARQLLDDDARDPLALSALLHLYEKTQQWISAAQTGEALLRLKPDDCELAKKLKGIVDQARRPSASGAGSKKN